MKRLLILVGAVSLLTAPLAEAQMVKPTLRSSDPQCSDGTDNDRDGWADFPRDPDCSDAYDDDETLSLYEYVRRFTVHEEEFGGAEPNIEDFVAGVMRDVLDIESQDVDRAYEELPFAVCQPGGGALSCQTDRFRVLGLAERAARFAGFTRAVALAASGHESGAGPLSLAEHLPAILKLWQSDARLSALPDSRAEAGSLSGGARLERDVEALINMLHSLVRRIERADGRREEDGEKLVAAVHRYRHGVAPVLAEGGCRRDRSGKGDGTALQFLSARFCDVEDQLMLIGRRALPELGEGEAGVRFTVGVDRGLDVTVWVARREDGGADGGLAWRTYVRPVLPSRNCTPAFSYARPRECVRGVILAGTYPAAPEDPAPGSGLCGDPLHEGGYLCRPLPLEACPPLDPAAVPLARCTKAALKGISRFSESGPNICLEGGWRLDSGGQKGADTPLLDPDLLPDRCSNCVVDLFCSRIGEPPTGGESFPLGYSLGAGGEPEPDGHRRVLTRIGRDDPLLPWLIIHELVHAQQKCNSPPGYEGDFLSSVATEREVCCATEYAAYEVSCRALAQDGVLAAVGYDVETCAAVFSNFSCGGEGSCSELAPGLTTDGIYGDIVAYVEEHREELKVPATCEDAIKHLDPRAQMIKNSLPQVCSPECPAAFRNSIGNLLCYAGQCLEQTFEEAHQPRRSPLVAFDQIAPWEGERRIPERDAMQKSAFRVAPNAEARPVPIPPYRPRFFIGKLDALLCRINALPRLSLPVLCVFEPAVQGVEGAAGVNDPEAVWTKLVDDPARLRALGEAMRSALPGVGAHYGESFVTQYLTSVLRPLDELVAGAGDLLSDLGETEFPRLLCPRDASSTL